MKQMTQKKKPARTMVGVRELKNHASQVLRRVKQGESVTITERHLPIAVMVPVGNNTIDSTIHQLAKTGRLTWGNGKPAGSDYSIRLKGNQISDTVIRDRR